MIEYKEVKDWEDPAEPVVAYNNGNTTLPKDSANRQYRLMLELVDAGEAVILPADPPPPPSPSVLQVDIVETSKVIIDGQSVGSLTVSLSEQIAALTQELEALKRAFETHKNAGAFTPAGHGGPR